jgi:non-ribosomal peptide synthase protein (TIGR01720 family)
LDLLHRVPPVYRTHINDVLLAALALAAAKRNSTDSVLLFMEGHGREVLRGDIDLSRTVGWFTALFPVVLRVPPSGDRGETLRSVKEQLRRIPNHGFGYGVLRYLRDQGGAQLACAARPQLLFNYLGQLGQTLNGRLLRLSRIHMETAHHPQALRPTQLEVNASVIDSKLHLDWTFSRNLHRQATVEQFALLYLECLRGIINHCLGPDTGGSTPSDFALAGLSQQELDQIYSQFGEK